MGAMAGRQDDSGAMGEFMLRNMLILFKILATLLPIPAAGVIASLIPGGWIFSLEKIKPDIKKISPIAGFKRLFSSSHVMEVFKMLGKCSVLLAILYAMITGSLAAFMQLQSLGLHEAIVRGFSIYDDVMLEMLGSIALFALIDIPLSKFMFTKKMKMTKHEVKEEFKSNDGNPQIKGRIRQLQRQLALGQITRTVPLADVIITNPTHYAVALKYDPNRATAPYIVAKGQDDIALYIREVASNHQVEIVEFPPLARAIYYTTHVNQQIPAQLYRAIAHVLSYVLQIKSWRTGQAEKPKLNKCIEIPTETLIPPGEIK
ncbi:flagellar biosynthesis protein FlhB [Serratia sp. M24T3]|nr:flagellar biosynthesis protein FlhB [Serratia sp. M24T3]